MKHDFKNPNEYKKNSTLQYDFAKKMLSLIKVRGGDKILDIGCGDGKITAEIATTLPEGQIIGTDLSYQMIDHAVKMHTPSKTTNLGFMVMNAERNVFRSQFNLALSFCCLHWVKNQLAALEGIRRSLVIGGGALLLVPLRHHELYSAIESTIESKEWAHYFVGFSNPHVFFTKKQYGALLMKAGLSVSLLEEEIMQYTFSSKIEMELFLKAWLPHINRIPESDQNKFMSDIGDRFLRLVPEKDGAVIMPLRMLKVCANKTAVTLRLYREQLTEGVLGRNSIFKPDVREDSILTTVQSKL